MTLQDELNYLRTFIKLSENDAVKRDCLEQFLNGSSKVLLLDADSLLFNVVNFHENTETENDLELQYDDFHSQVRAIVNRIEDDGVNVDNVLYFFTTCSKNFRKEIYPEYKANREFTPTVAKVSLLKYYTISMLESEGEYVGYSDTLEADDLIKEAVELMDNTIVCSIDKDLKQLVTAHFDYYRVKIGEDEEGNAIRDYRGWSYTTPQESYDMLLTALLVGDTSDNIQGIKGIGVKKAEKLLKEKSNFVKLLSVARQYNDFKRLRMNLNLIKL